MRSALLRGREHLAQGAVAAIAEGPAAIALSIGGHAKTYRHTDPNEDAALFALGEAGTLVAVADGHHGFEAAEIALDHLTSNAALQWTEPGGIEATTWERHALAALCDINAQILREVLNTEKQGSRTTLALALLLPEQDALLYASVGDSHIFQVRTDGVEDVAVHAPEGDKRCFLGFGPETPDSLVARCAIGVHSLNTTCAMVLATDGLSEPNIGVPDPEAAVAEVVTRVNDSTPELRPMALARSVVEVALDSHRKQSSGDNASAAVVWVSD